MQNVRAMQVTWPHSARNKAQYVARLEETRSILVDTRNYVLLRRFSAKEQSRRLIAAPLLAKDWKSPLVGLENHLNYVYRRGGDLSEFEAYGLAALFNSLLIDIYFRTSNGNTQVSATEIRSLPLPDMEIIVEIGRRCLARNPSEIEVDQIVSEVCDWRALKDSPHEESN